MTSAETVYLFRHALLRDAAYQLQLPRDRARLHGLALEVMEQICGGRPPVPPPLEDAGRERFAPHPSDAFAEALAEHAQRAPEEMDFRGVSAASLRKLYLRRAAEHAAKFFQGEASERLWRQHAALASGVEKGESFLRAADVARERGDRKRAQADIQEAMTLAPGASQRFVAHMLGAQAALYLEVGWFTKAESFYTRSLKIQRAAGDRREEGATLANLGVVARQQGRAQEAERLLGEALSIQREIGNREAECTLLGNLGAYYAQMGRTEEAAQAIDSALASARSRGDRRAEGVSLGLLAALHGQRGNLKEAASACRQAIAFDIEVGSRPGQGIALQNLATVEYLEGNLERAKATYLQALEIHREVGNRASEGTTLGNLSQLLKSLGLLDDAVRCCEEALAISRQVGDRRHEGISLGNLAGLHQKSGKLDDAERLFRMAIELHRKNSNRGFEGSHLCDLACLFVARGREAEAREAWIQGRLLLRQAGTPVERERTQAAMRAGCGEAGVSPLEEPPE
ncbi:MAG: tetratricopeptide repeat protein [Planctomycetota bacterium]